VAAGRPIEARAFIRELLDTSLPAFERDLREMYGTLANAPERPAATASRQFMGIAQAMLAGQQKYTSIRAPALAIYALPRQRPPAVAANPMLRTAADALDSTTALQATAFEQGVPSARVVRLPSASHYLYMSNEADVLRAIRAFAGSLPGGR
jgi:pimeloyl-ACP methyl ester carboxylesterase